MFEGAPLAYWIGFLTVVLVVTVCDLAILNHRKAGSGPSSVGTASQAGAKTRTRIRTNLFSVLVLLAVAAAFGLWLAQVRGREAGLEFASGYLIELSLSIDNLFVFLLMFRSFGLGPAKQKKVLLLGILGAIVMRGLFILAGIGLLRRFVWVQYVFGAFLFFAAARLWRAKMSRGSVAPAARRSEPEGPEGRGRARPETPGTWTERLARRWSGNANRVLLSAVVAIELVDLVFALDSIPAVLAVTRSPFVAYTSNILAILGLRSLYFLLANLLDRLRFLHFGLAAILAFVGVKMVLARWFQISIEVSLGVIFLLAAIATAASLLSPARAAEWQQEPK